MDAGSWMSVVKVNVTSVTTTAARATHEDAAPCSGVARRCAGGPSGHQREDHQRDRAADRRDSREVEGDDDDDDGHGQDDQPERRPTAEPSGHDRRELARRDEVVGQAGRRVQAGVRRAGRREQRGHGHEPVAEHRRARVARRRRSRSVRPRSPHRPVSVPKTPMRHGDVHERAPGRSRWSSPSAAGARDGRGPSP